MLHWQYFSEVDIIAIICLVSPQLSFPNYVSLVQPLAVAANTNADCSNSTRMLHAFNFHKLITLSTCTLLVPVQAGEFHALKANSLNSNFSRTTWRKVLDLNDQVFGMTSPIMSQECVNQVLTAVGVLQQSLRLYH